MNRVIGISLKNEQRLSKFGKRIAIDGIDVLHKLQWFCSATAVNAAAHQAFLADADL